MQSPKRTAPVRETLRAKAEPAVETKVVLDQSAIDQGRKPVPARRKDYEAIKAKVIELYGIPASGLSALPAIEAGFKLSRADTDNELQFLHVEGLLDEAASLLDRCATLKSRHDALQLEKWKLQLELDRFFRLDALSERLREAGADTVAYERAALEAGAESSLETNHKSAESHLDGLSSDLLSSGFNKRMAARELSAWLSAYPLKDADLRGDDAFYTFDGARKSKPEHLFEAARMEADEAAWEQIADLTARRFAANGASEAGRLRKVSLERAAKCRLAEIASHTERAAIEKDAGWEKAFQAQSPGSALNYSERIAAIERAFATDFREALARLAAARRGLKEVYDYAPPFPDETAPGYFDEVLLWTNQARTRGARVANSEQIYTLALSLSQLSGAQWASGLGASEWTFEIPADVFKGQAHVRLRGIGIAVVVELPPPGGKSKATPTGEGFWSATVSFPPVATIRHASGTVQEIDQKSLPSCFLGRIADRDSGQQPEICGASALHNASPIGKQWKLSLSPKSTGGSPSSGLRDVELFLRVAVRSMPSGS